MPVATGPKGKLAGVTDNCVEPTTEAMLMSALSPGFGSTLSAETETVLVMTPAACGVTMKVIDATPLLASDPILQTTRPNASVVQVPCAEVADTKVTPLGGTSVTVMPVAAAGPLLVTVIV